MLGAPFGNAAYCEAHTAARVAKAESLLEAIGDYGHSQGALLLLRHCASWSKLVYSARVVPPILHKDAMARFGTALRRTTAHLAGQPLEDRSWHLAQLAIARGGLGLRDPTRHAPVCYVASVLQAHELCS